MVVFWASFNGGLEEAEGDLIFNVENRALTAGDRGILAELLEKEKIVDPDSIIPSTATSSFDVELEILFNLSKLASCRVDLFGETTDVDESKPLSTKSTVDVDISIFQLPKQQKKQSTKVFLARNAFVNALCT